MTKAEVMKAEKSAPVRRTATSLVYRDKKFGTSVESIFEFTDGKLDALAYVADPRPRNPELVFLNWCLALTKRYGQGVVYLNKKPVGRPGVVLDDSLKEFWKQSKGEIVVVYPPEGITNVGVGIRFINGLPSVELDLGMTPPDNHGALSF